MAKTGQISTWSATAVALVVALCSAAAAQAASINYGNVGPVAPGITFLNVVESSGTDGVPLYDAPSPFATGLDFTPDNFISHSTAGAADITDGQLNFTIHGQDGNGNNVAISSINLSESGVYSLTGVGTAATQVTVGAIMSVKITEIDGVAVTPISLMGNASVTKNLVVDPTGGLPWLLNVLIDVESELTTLGIPFITGATRADVVLNNTLVSISELNSTASVSKTAFAISIVPELEVVPEPCTLGMAGLALCGVGLASRRKRS